MRKKILIITPFNPKFVGGAETFCRDLITEAQKRFEVCCITKKRQYKDWDTPSIAQSIGISFVLLVKALLQRKYQTVHCLGITATAVGVVLKRLFGVKLISTTLALYGFANYPAWKLSIVKWIFNQADKVFVEDCLGKNDMLMLDTPLKKLGIFMHWVDLKRFRPLPFNSVYPFKVLFVGRPIYKKGRHIIEQVESKLKDKQILFQYLESISYEDLPYYYAYTDIVVVPSLYPEGVSRVVIEAAACGCCVIASNRGSLPNLVEQFGIVIPATPWHFKNEIMKLYNDRRTLKRYKTIARDYAERNFNSKNAEVILNEY